MVVTATIFTQSQPRKKRRLDQIGKRLRLTLLTRNVRFLTGLNTYSDIGEDPLCIKNRVFDYNYA